MAIYGREQLELDDPQSYRASDLADPDASEKYAAFKHFSRYVRPGAVRIESTFTGGQASVGGASQYDTLHSVNVSDFLHEEDQTLTYVLLNMTDSSESITINLPNEFTFEAFDQFRSSEVERFEELPTLLAQNDQLSLSLPRYSLVTLVGTFLEARNFTVTTTMMARWTRRTTWFGARMTRAV